MRYIVLFFILQIVNCQIPASQHRTQIYNVAEFANPKTIILIEKTLPVERWEQWATFLPGKRNFTFFFTFPIASSEFHQLIIRAEAMAVIPNVNVTFQTQRTILNGFSITTEEYDSRSERDHHELDQYRSYPTLRHTQLPPNQRQTVLVAQCPWSQICAYDHTSCVGFACHCDKGYFANPNGGCAPIARHGEPCQFQEQCWNSNSELVCQNGLCLCPPAEIWAHNKCNAKMKLFEIYPTTKSAIDASAPKVIVSKLQYPALQFVQSDFVFKALGPVIFKTDTETNFLTTTNEYQLWSWKNYTQTWEGASAFPNFTVFAESALVKPEPRVGFYFDEEFRVDEQISYVNRFALGNFFFDAGICKVEILNVTQGGEFRIFTNWIEGIGIVQSCGVFFNQTISAAQITLWYKNVSFSEVYVAGAVTKSSSVQIQSGFFLDHDHGSAKVGIVNLVNQPFNFALCRPLEIETQSNWLIFYGGLLFNGLIAGLFWAHYKKKKDLIYDEVEDSDEVEDEVTEAV